MAGKKKEPSPIKKDKPSFNPRVLDKTTIALPLLQTIRDIEQGKRPDDPIRVILDVNLEFRPGREKAQKELIATIEAEIAASKKAGGERVETKKTMFTRQYVFARLRGSTIMKLVLKDKENAASEPDPQKARALRIIYRIWPDFLVKPYTSESIKTVKADAAHRSFQALGDKIVWAVVDSGIDKKHPHFKEHGNLDLPPGLKHWDFTLEDEHPTPDDEHDKTALVDDFGHGTHVAGIIAGRGAAGHMRAVTRRKEDDTDEANIAYEDFELDAISGMAPKAKLLSLKVLDEKGQGQVSSVIVALAAVERMNSNGRLIQIQGVNLSLGYPFDAEWFACGGSPLCVEIDHLVKSGVVVVAASGNTGYGEIETSYVGTSKTSLALTINDPGNADLAITVGSTHRDKPHLYGVSFFSSKGPTGDGRPKPDLVAPGEKILSCAAGSKRDATKEKLTRKRKAVDYIEDSGTSMAAPHVSGVIAAFLSLRPEFIGHAEEVKKIFCESATDLKRERYFQGHGLVDLMRAIQSV